MNQAFDAWRRLCSRLSWVLVWTLAATLPVLAQHHHSGQASAPAHPHAPPVEALRAVPWAEGDGRMRVDGRLDEAAWARAPAFERFTQYLPLDLQPPPAGNRTTVRIVTEPDALVFGIEAFDPDPDAIRAPLTRRDQVRRDQDFVAVYIDAVGDRRAAQLVRVNAAGVVADGVYLASTDSEDYAPDFDVEAAVARTPQGYTVELRVPLMTLRYPHQGGAAWRVMVSRSVPRASSVLLLSVPLAKDGLSFIADMPVVPGLDDMAEQARHQSLLTVRPELTARSSRQTQTAGVTTRERELSLGAELKWRPRADWVFDATLNPDFSQVELDAPQLAGNTRFALSVPEKRPFFLESTDVIDLPLVGFYSRSVTDPGYGLRATWRAPEADATALTLRDDGGGLVLRPGPYGTAVYAQDLRSQASLWRARRHGLLGQRGLTLGLLVSDRTYDNEAGTNRVAGADLLWSPGTQDQFRLRGLHSHTTAGFDSQGVALRTTPERGHWVELRWSRRTRDWVFNANATDLSPRFRNDNGFVDQAGVSRVEVEAIRRWGEVAAAGFQAHEFETYQWLQLVTTRSDPALGVPGGEAVARRWHPGIWFAGPRNAEGWFEARVDAERTRPGGRLHPVRGVGGHFAFNPTPWWPRVAVQLAAGERVDVEADQGGHGADGFVEAQLRGQWGRLGWELEQKLEASTLRRQGAHAFTDAAARWLGVLHLSASESLRVVWQAGTYRRSADVASALTAARQDSRIASWVFQHRVGIGRHLSVGYTRARTDAGQTTGVQRRDEWFAKGAFTI